jgi:signal transduction histidine kinase
VTAKIEESTLLRRSGTLEPIRGPDTSEVKPSGYFSLSGGSNALTMSEEPTGLARIAFRAVQAARQRKALPVEKNTCSRGVQPKTRAMHSNDDCIEDVARGDALWAPRAATKSSASSSSATVEAQQASDDAALLVAIAGHDLRQPLQAIQCTHELLGLGIRTKSELRLLRSGQRAIDRLTAQLDQLLAALRLRDPQGVKPMPLHLMHVLQQVGYENEFEALKKGIKLGVIPSSLAIQSDRLLFGAILRNLVRNAVRFTDPGGRWLPSGRRRRSYRNLRHRYRDFCRRDASDI